MMGASSVSWTVLTLLGNLMSLITGCNFNKIHTNNTISGYWMKCNLYFFFMYNFGQFILCAIILMNEYTTSYYFHTDADASLPCGGPLWMGALGQKQCILALFNNCTANYEQSERSSNHAGTVKEYCALRNVGYNDTEPTSYTDFIGFCCAWNR
jgi:tRNA G26 N,N-dimethylase Trm1